jgi:hypothetical protein
MSQTSTANRPRSGSVTSACAYCGLSRSKLYGQAPRYPGLFKKWDGKTIVDFNILDQIIDGLPDAAIKAPGPTAGKLKTATAAETAA